AAFIARDFTATRNSPVWNVFLFLPLLAGLIWTFSAATVRRQSPDLSGSNLSTLNLFSGTFLLSILALSFFVVMISINRTATGTGGEIARALIGFVPGMIVATGLMWSLARWPLRKIRNRYAELSIIGLPPAIVFILMLNWPRLVPAISLFALF